MKILPLQTFNPYHQSSQQQNAYIQKSYVKKSAPPPLMYNTMVLRDTGYNSLLLNKNNPVFRGALEKSALSLAKQIPLEDRLADAFSFMKHGDLIITGKNIKDSQKAMMESLGKLKNVIKRAFFIEDDNFNGTLGFTKNALNETEVINANPGRLFLTTDGKEYYLDAHDSYYVINGDSLKYNGSILNIKQKPKTNLSMHRHIYAKAFDFQKEADEMIEKQNKKSLMQIFQEKKPAHKVMFSDVAGQDEIVNELKESILYPLRMPRAYENMDLTHGFILTGPPGTGKTYIANALRNEAGMKGRYLNGLELESKWVGESEKGWRDLFDEAVSNQPYLIFIDEFDAVARARGGSDQFGDKVVNQILTLMTDIDDNKHDVFVLAATNHFDALDPAIIRSGRFGKHLHFKLPDLDATRKIFDIHSRNKPLSEDLSKDAITQKMFDLKASGADIKRLISDAYLKGYRRAGILEKLDKNALSDADLDNFRIVDEDFDSAIQAFAEGRTKRKPIGFNQK
ncbi:aAA family ATPase CDC48 subfamily [Brachyspira sp. CAG:484]|nr:aAA family ATPase CDC48 subfamily [Brachyspira sp. CAG:484]